MFQASTYQQRRQILQDRLKSGLLLFLGNEESSMNYVDNVYPFRQDSRFLYYFGLDKPHLAAIMDLEEGKTILFGDDLTVEHIVWMGPQPAMQELGAQVGVGETAPFQEVVRYLKRAQDQGRTIHFLPPYRPEHHITLHKWLGIPLDEVANHVSVPFIQVVIEQGSVKSEEELVEMERAVNVSGAMHIAAMQHARPGMKEQELVGIVQGIAGSQGPGTSYPVIMTVDGQTLHNHYHGNTMKAGHLVLGDFGAEVPSRYAGDITRTFPVDRTFTTRQREIYEIVLEMQLSCIEALKPGVKYLDVHLLAAQKLVWGLKSLGLMQGDVDEAVAAGAHALFFPHGLGHMIGLDVHDMENLGEDLVGYDEDVKRVDQFGLRSLRLGKALKTGYVITVEPGCYFIPELIDQWKAAGKHDAFINYEKVETYKDFSGIRIEDDVLITENGYRILGGPIPKSIAEVENLRRY